MIMENTGEEIFLHRQVLLNLNDVSHAEVKRYETQKEYRVNLALTRPGKWKFSEITGDNLGKRLGIIVDRKLLMAPKINAQINFGKTAIFFGIEASEAEKLTSRINSILASLPKADQNDTEDISLDSLYPAEKLNLEGPYLFELVHISEIIKLEESLGSRKIEKEGTTQIKLPNAEKLEFGKPLEYNRPPTGHLTPHVLYAFSKPDSVVRFIAYAFLVKLENLKQRELIEEHYFRLDEGIYPRLKEILISKLGKPEQEDVIRELKQTEESTVQTKTSSWKKSNMTLSVTVSESQSAVIHIYWK